MLARFRTAITVLSVVYYQIVGFRKTDPNVVLHWRIVGGRSLEDTRERPYMVSIQQCSMRQLQTHCPVPHQQHDCGGGLINRFFVITACHCVAFVSSEGTHPAEPIKINIKTLTFVAGTSDLIKREPHAQVRYARKLTHHPKCGLIQGNIVYDIGLAEMTEPFDFNDYVQPLKFFENDSDLERKVDEISDNKNLPQRHLPKSQTVLPQPSHCNVAGWGDIRPGQYDTPIASDILNSVSMYALPEEACVATYTLRDESYAEFSFRKYHQICAVSKYGNQSDCVGDSGSPFVCDGSLIAVVSYGYECGSPMPSIYQTVATLSSWFRSEIYQKTQNSISSRVFACNYLNEELIICLACLCGLL